MGAIGPSVVFRTTDEDVPDYVSARPGLVVCMLGFGMSAGQRNVGVESPPPSSARTAA